MSRVTIHTDGACSGNPGPGGWAFILRHPAKPILTTVNTPSGDLRKPRLQPMM